MSAPERMWWNVAPLPHSYTSTIQFAGGTEYRRADLPPTDAEVMKHPKVKALVKALEFYADKNKWLSDVPYIGAEAEVDMGDNARAALAAIQEDKP